MAEKKMTQKDMFAIIAERCADDAMIVEFCEKKIAQLSKPRSARKTNPEVEEFRAAVATFLSEQDEPVTNKMVSEALEVSSQKASSALRALVDKGVAKVEGKGTKADPKLFSIA